MFEMVKHPLYEGVVMAVIALNCVLLAMDDSTVAPDSSRRRLIDRTDFFFAVFFVAEMGMKMIAWGVWGCGPTYVVDVLASMWLLRCGCGRGRD